MLQLLSIGKRLYDACGISMTGPLSEWPLPELPPWAKTICEQLRLTIFKRYLELKPQGDSVDWRKLGRVLGVGFRELGFAKHDSPPEKEVSRLNAEIEVPGLEQILSCLSADNRAETLLARISKLLEDSIHLGLAEKPAAQHEFLAGLAEGHELFLDVQGQLVGDRGRTHAYFELLSRWMEIEEMRQAKPAKTCADLYALLAPSLGDPRCERYESFFGICKDIGLAMTSRGRPWKQGENK